MTALVVALAAAVALLCVLVVGILRSHAAILERLDALDRGQQLHDPPHHIGTGEAVAVGDLQGVAPEGTQAVSVRVAGVEHDTVVAFLSSTCVTCQRFWDAFRTPRRLGLPNGTRLVVVTMGPEAERPGSVTKLAPPDVATVMSTEAFDQYAVPGAPYFVHVHGPSGRVLAADTASDWDHVRSLLDRTAGDAAR